jgi:type IV pilus assembly protein PilB
LTAADALRLEQVVSRDDAGISEILEREGVIEERDLAVLLADSLRLPLLDMTSIAVDPQLTRLVKEGLATKYQVVPVRLEDGVITVATTNPLDLDALRAVEFATGKRTQAAVATRTELRDALTHAYRLEESLDQFLRNVPAASEALMVTELREEGSDLRTIAQNAELAPVVRLVDLILLEGIKNAASDIHLEPLTNGVVVRYRIDGILEEGFRLPKWVQSPLTARFKVLAKLDITERRVPQDGRIQVRYKEGSIDLRVSSLPTNHGEKITLRILDARRAVRKLEELGFSDLDLGRLRDAARRPEGLILVTGPTGSGKTTTLYAILQEILNGSLNIVTIENPIEYQLPGINQVEVNEKQGLTFASVLRSTLRQDPDVILVGEIRDQETAQIAIQAAQTGHLVLSTLHTNDAASTVTRLLDLGIEPYALASSLHLVVAQRLVRQVCAACSETYVPDVESSRLLRLEQGQEFRRGTGCATCRHHGYSGRLAVYELLSVSSAMAKTIESGGSDAALRQQARNDGFPSLLDDAQTKLRLGVTTAEEIVRVVQISEMRPGCPQCGREVEESFVACPHCSFVLRANCAGCGKHLTASWASCPYCGLKSEVAAVAAPVAEVVAAVVALSPGASLAPVARPVADDGAGRRTYKALVVDDDPDLRRIVRMTLERSDLGLTVITAQDGHEALALAEIERPDIVLLDLSMPNMDGFSVCRQLRSDVRTAFVPVMMLTAEGSEESVAQGFQSGTDDYVVKPFRREDLLARVRRMIERTYGRGPLRSVHPAESSGLSREVAA